MPWHKDKPEQMFEFTLSFCKFGSHQVRGIDITYDDFRKVLWAVRIVAAQQARHTDGAQAGKQTIETHMECTTHERTRTAV